MTKLERLAMITLGELLDGGEFATWVDNKEMPYAALRELDQAREVLLMLREEHAKAKE